MDILFHQLIEQQSKTNELLEKQNQTIELLRMVLRKQEQALELMSNRVDHIENLMLKMAEILDRELVTLLDQPLLDKSDVMDKLGISDSAYRSYVRDNKLKPISLGKIDYYFQRDLVKTLLETKGRKRG